MRDRPVVAEHDRRTAEVAVVQRDALVDDFGARLVAVEGTAFGLLFDLHVDDLGELVDDPTELDSVRQQTASDMADEGYPIVEWPTGSLPRIVPAWKDYYAAIMDGELSHDGNKAMARHHENMTLKVDSKGTRPTKEHPTSIRHIDLGICAIGAYTNRHLEVEVPKKRKPWVLTG